MSSIHETAEKLHALGHEVAAAAVRRSAMLPKDYWREIQSHRIPRGAYIHAARQLEQPAQAVDSYHHLPRAFRPGIGYTHFYPDGGDTDVSRAFNVMRVGRHVGPISTAELQQLVGHRPHTAPDHPLVTAGHGLHPVHDPSPESFDFLKQHIDNPSMWPIVADHFEDGGTTRGDAMARLLREPVVEPYDTSRTGHMANHGNLMSPVTWPIPVHWDAQHNRFGVRIGKHVIMPREDDDTKPSRIRRGLVIPHFYRNLESMTHGLKAR